MIGCFGDFITTDHISPAGSIAPDSPAAAYLRERGVEEGTSTRTEAAAAITR